jgi:hypothetical protein
MKSSSTSSLAILCLQDIERGYFKTMVLLKLLQLHCSIADMGNARAFSIKTPVFFYLSNIMIVFYRKIS